MDSFEVGMARAKWWHWGWTAPAPKLANADTLRHQKGPTVQVWLGCRLVLQVQVAHRRLPWRSISVSGDPSVGGASRQALRKTGRYLASMIDRGLILLAIEDTRVVSRRILQDCGPLWTHMIRIVLKVVRVA